jgi:uncharacterized protein YlxP (DUF503 family)
MFVGVARLSLHIGESGSLKGKRSVLRKVIERVKARFNASIAEVEDQDLWQKATIALAVVGGDQRHVNEQLEKIIRFVDEMYVAPLTSREIEILSFNEQLFQHETAAVAPELLTIPKGDRSLAEAEGLGSWEERFEEKPKKGKGGHPHSHPPAAPGSTELTLEERRQKARRLRNPRDWEQE